MSNCKTKEKIICSYFVHNETVQTERIFYALFNEAFSIEMLYFKGIYIHIHI